MPKVVTRGMDHCTPGAIEKRERIYAHSAYDDAEKNPFEMYARGPGQRTITAHPASGDTTWTLNGNSAWVAAPATDKPVPVLAITGPELDGVKLESEVFFPARIKTVPHQLACGLPDAH